MKRTSSISFTTAGYSDYTAARDLVAAVKQIPTSAKNLALDVSYSDGEYGRLGRYTIELTWED